MVLGKVVITGASGFIGRRLESTLVEGGAEVIALRREASPPRDGSEASNGGGRRFAQIDYADVGSLARVFEAERPDYVFHVAGSTKGVTYRDFQSANVMPTQHLLEALQQVGHTPKRFVHVSSLTSYGPSAIDRPHVESNERKPVEFYGKSKLEAEQVVETRSGEIPWTIIRPGGVYGPGDVDYFELFKSVHRGMNVFFGNRKRWMSVVYVDDVVRAILDAAESPAAIRKGYFICDGEPVSFEAFQRVIVEASGRRVRDLDLPDFLVSIAAFGGELATAIDKKPRLFNRQKAAMGRQEAWTCTHAAARTDFGYRVRVPLADGVKRTFEWYRSSGWL